MKLVILQHARTSLVTAAALIGGSQAYNLVTTVPPKPVSLVETKHHVEAKQHAKAVRKAPKAKHTAARREVSSSFCAQVRWALSTYPREAIKAWADQATPEQRAAGRRCLKQKKR
jgi:hypothetical protein